MVFSDGREKNMTETKKSIENGKEIDHMAEKLQALCLEEKKPMFLCILTSEKASCKTVLPEEAGLPEDKRYNAFVRAMAGFDKEDYK